VAGSILHCLGYGYAQGAGGIRHLCQDLPAELGLVRGAGEAVRTPDPHSALPVGLAVKAGADHIDGAFEAEEAGGQR